MTVEDCPVVNGDPRDITEQDVERIREWIKANRTQIEDIWNDDVHVWDTKFILASWWGARDAQLLFLDRPEIEGTPNT